MTRVAAAREPLIDVVRAVAMVGVVVGHWLVTAAVAVPGGVLDGLSLHSPLRAVPELVPLSWFLQTLGLFFFAGGYASCVSQRRALERGESLPRWFLARCRKLAVATVVVLAAWVVVLALLGWLADMRWASIDIVINLVTSPLWFIGVYVVLLGATAVTRWLHDRLGVAAVVVPVTLAVLAETAGGVVGMATLVFVWWVPWQLGVALASGWRPRWFVGVLLAAVGIAVMVYLVYLAGYPASAVGGTAVRSNLNPPSPFALALAVAQVGVVLTVAPVLRRLGGLRPVVWINERALPIFLTHQSALVTVLLIGGAFGSLHGLNTLPLDYSWVLARLAWIPAFAAVLLVLLAALRQVFGRR